MSEHGMRVVDVDRGLAVDAELRLALVKGGGSSSENYGFASGGVTYVLG